MSKEEMVREATVMEELLGAARRKAEGNLLSHISYLEDTLTFVGMILTDEQENELAEHFEDLIDGYSIRPWLMQTAMGGTTRN